jgi:hypothetical protein
MASLASAEPLPDFEGTLRVIRSGGKKAIGMDSLNVSRLYLTSDGTDWLKDKQVGSPFALPALYQPASKIPLDIWRASPSTSNGNEQSHRNVNRDGIKLTMLAGIMRGMHYDARAMQGLDVLQQYGIHSRDQHATHFRRAARAIGRSSE